MSDSLATILMLAAVVVLVVTVTVWVGPMIRPRSARGAAPGVAPGPASTTTSPAPSPSIGTGPMAQGFGYLFSPLGRARRQTDVGSRLEYALRRIDSVDPYVNHRRIGMALMPTEADEPRETRND